MPCAKCKCAKCQGSGKSGWKLADFELPAYDYTSDISYNCNRTRRYETRTHVPKYEGKFPIPNVCRECRGSGRDPVKRKENKFCYECDRDAAESRSIWSIGFGILGGGVAAILGLPVLLSGGAFGALTYYGMRTDHKNLEDKLNAE